MKKFKGLLAVTALLVGFSASAQRFRPAVKANFLYNSAAPTWKGLLNTGDTVREIFNQNGQGSAGFNVGFSLKTNLPVMGLYVMPELYYTRLTNSLEVPAAGTTYELKATTNRVDLPVLLGYNVWGDNLSVYAGPVASVNVTGNETFQQFEQNASNHFTVGYQLGAEAQFSSLIATVRYEGSFSNDQRTFINRQLGQEIRYDNRPNMLILGLGYAF